MKKIWKQQQNNNLERFIELSCDLNVDGNVIPAITLADFRVGSEQYDIHDLLKIVAKRQFQKKIGKEIRLSDFCLIKTIADINFIDENNKKKFSKEPIFAEYVKYAEDIKKGASFPPVILIHPTTLEELLEMDIPDDLYQLDGMRRVMSTLHAGEDKVDVMVLTPRNFINYLIDDEIIDEISGLRSKSTWFPNYQELMEIGLDGERWYAPRYTEIYNFSFLKDKTVVDFGGSSGQAALEAYFCGANKIYSFDCQRSLADTVEKISQTLGANIISDVIDFNSDTFTDDVFNIVEEWDWAIFQAIYRTKEIKDIKPIFKFIVENSKEGIIFEGNADPKIDTDEFYQNIFKEFNFSDIKFLGHSDKRPAYILTK